LGIIVRMSDIVSLLHQVSGVRAMIQIRLT
jgi:hypothetical protein